MQANEMVRPRPEIGWYRIGVAEDLLFLYLETKKANVNVVAGLYSLLFSVATGNPLDRKCY
jgi:hypothetical protein